MPTFFPYILSYGKGNSARLRNKMKKQISKDNKRSVNSCKCSLQSNHRQKSADNFFNLNNFHSSNSCEARNSPRNETILAKQL